VRKSREPDTGWVDAPRRLDPPLDLADLELPPVETSDGLLLPIPHSSPGYFYFSRNRVWFELMMGMETDLVVRLCGSLQLILPDGEVLNLDAASPRRSDLAPLLQLRDREVNAGSANVGGELRIDFGGDYALLASSDRGFGWEVTWPSWWVVGHDRRVDVKGARPGPAAQAGVAPVTSTPPDDPTEGRPLPIHGPIDQCDASSSTIELEIGNDSADRYCIHFAGSLTMTKAGHRQAVDGGRWGRQNAGPMLDVIGRAVVGASMDERHLSLDLDDGTRIHTSDDSWEAHWGERDEEWVPDEGPRFP
jgi:hypothetical protein